MATTIHGKHLPECWGHRGASATYPENTLASFEAAIRDGAEGLESDVHVSTDDVIVMFHDPTLQRTTDGHGAIKDQAYYGKGGMEHCRTRKEPKQPIPTFVQTVELLMKPENRHVKFNIDVKVNNEPEQLFTLMAAAISSQPGWETALAPRILLGLWHPKFLAPAKRLLPYCRRSYIGVNVSIARQYFWDDCDAFSVLFEALVGKDGQEFIKECKAAKKQLCVWTVNPRNWMLEAVRWEVDAILTDVTKTWLNLREALRYDYDGIMATADRHFVWRSPRFYFPMVILRQQLLRGYLEHVGGPFGEPSKLPLVDTARVATVQTLYAVGTSRTFNELIRPRIFS